mgnify:CR=1 FL=1
MFEFLKDTYNYEQRKIVKEFTNGLGISTAYTSDEGYETALLDTNGVHPVERYATRELAVEGHKKWVKFSEGNENKVIELGGLAGFVKDKEIVLLRNYEHKI